MIQQQNSAVLAISVLVLGIVIVFIGFSAAGSSADEGAELPTAEIDSQEQSITETEEYVEIVEQDEQEIRIEGRISDGFSGGTIVIDSVENNDGDIRVSLSVERPEVGNTVITGYQYDSTIRTEGSIDSLVVSHSDEEFVLIGDERPEQDSIKLDIHNQGISDTFTESAEITSRSENSVIVEGRILAEQAEEEIIIDSYEYNNGVLTVNIDTVAPNEDRFYPQIIQYQSYRIDAVSDQFDLSNVDMVVNHINGDRYNLGMKDSNMNEGPTSEITEQDSSAGLDSEYAVVNTEDGVSKVRGIIVGNTGGQTVYVEDVNVRGGKTYVNIGLESADGFATQVITGYKYEAIVDDPVGDVVVQHEGENVDGEIPIDRSDLEKGMGDINE